MLDDRSVFTRQNKRQKEQPPCKKRTAADFCCMFWIFEPVFEKNTGFLLCYASVISNRRACSFSEKSTVRLPESKRYSVGSAAG